MKMSAAAIGLSILALAGHASAGPNPQVEEGRRVALNACSGCHAIDRGKSPAEKAPPFRTLYTRMRVADLPGRFQDGMMLSHNQMPIVRLGADQVIALTEYLESLGPMGARPQ